MQTNDLCQIEMLDKELFDFLIVFKQINNVWLNWIFSDT